MNLREKAVKAVLTESNVLSFIERHLNGRSPEEAVLFLNDRKALGLVQKGRFDEALGRLNEALP